MSMHRSLPSNAPALPAASARQLEPAADTSSTNAPPAPRRSWGQIVLGPYLRHPRLWSSQQTCFILISTIALCYLVLYHPYWVRGGDSELYLAMARHLARGEGYRYNGQPVSLVPPGWPLLLAGGMSLTSNIALLKLILLGSILLYLGAAFHVLRRYASAGWAAAAVAIVAFCQPTWQLSIWFFSDAPFLAASWLALLLAVQAREVHESGGGGWRLGWRIGALLALLSVCISIRWNGLLWWPVLALALLDTRRLGALSQDGELRLRLWPARWDRMWVAAGLCLITGLCTFLLLRQALKVDPSQIDPRYGTFESGIYDVGSSIGEPTISTLSGGLRSLPQWISVVGWNQVARARTTRDLMFFVAALATISIAWAVLRGLRQRQWLWLGAAAALLPVVLLWPHAIDRYCLPVAPFMALAVLVGTAALHRMLHRSVSRPWLFALLTAVLTLGLWSATRELASRFADSARAMAPEFLAQLAAFTNTLLPYENFDPLSLRLVMLGLLALVVVLAVRNYPRRGQSGEPPAMLPWLIRCTPIWLVAPAALSLLAYNSVVFGMEAWVARDPVNRHEAGAQKPLASIGYFLRMSQRESPQEIAVAPVRALNGVRLETLGPRRKLVWLADHPVIDVPYILAHEPGHDPELHNIHPPFAPNIEPGDDLTQQLIDWLRANNVRWYVVMPMQERFLHLPRFPPFLRQGAALQPPAPDTGWRLYEILPGGPVRRDVGSLPGDVMVVPGLEDGASSPTSPRENARAGYLSAPAFSPAL